MIKLRSLLEAGLNFVMLCHKTLGTIGSHLPASARRKQSASLVSFVKLQCSFSIAQWDANLQRTCLSVTLNIVRLFTELCVTDNAPLNLNIESLTRALRRDTVGLLAGRRHVRGAC